MQPARRGGWPDAPPPPPGRPAALLLAAAAAARALTRAARAAELMHDGAEQRLGELLRLAPLLWPLEW